MRKKKWSKSFLQARELSTIKKTHAQPEGEKKISCPRMPNPHPTPLKNNAWSLFYARLPDCLGDGCLLSVAEICI